MTKKRADRLLLERGHCSSIDEARRIIMAGELFYREQRVQNPSVMLPENAVINLRRNLYVSRGGDKLASAVDAIELASNFNDAKVLDVGASTGGFTDFALQNGAREVFSVDVGHGHFHWKLRNDNRVRVFEKTDIRDFSDLSHGPFDLVIGDISFNSIRRLLPAILKCSLDIKTEFLLLVKPQYELSANDVTGGVVKSRALQQHALALVSKTLEMAGCEVLEFVKSAVRGRAGNQEYFCHFRLQNLSLTEEFIAQNH